MVYVFSIALGILAFWLLSFIISDIGSLRGPSLAEVEKRYVDADLVRERTDLGTRIAEIDRNVKAQEARQRLLRDSTNNSQQTMNQLLQMQRLKLQKGIELTEKEREALADSEERFLANQRQYQTLNLEIVRLKEEERVAEQKRRAVDKELQTQHAPARKEHDALLRRHKLRMASLKLAVLIPILLATFVFFVKKRGGPYAPVIYAVGIAVTWKVGAVMHRYFPSRYFKYILILVSLAIVLKVLVSLLRTIAAPKMDWLLKQYREAYEKFFCPICAYPIRRGPLKYMVWTRRSIKKLPPRRSAGSEADEPYTCPACGETLYVECESCHAVRHALLPFCEKCGVEKALASGSES